MFGRCRTKSSRLALQSLSVSFFSRARLARTTCFTWAQRVSIGRPSSPSVFVGRSPDDNFNATVKVQYKPSGTSQWVDGLPLYRVRADLVTGGTATPEFAGSIFNLKPATAYDIQLTAHDPDGGDQTTTTSATTRAVPSADPAQPNVVNVSTAAQLTTALNAAKAGDVITLAAGTYTGEFTLNASGTKDNPIVIRGVDRDTVILDGGNGGGNVLAIEGSFSHVERLTLQHDTRALRFHGSPASDNVVRRVHAKDVILGFGSNPQQQDFYLCDNLLEGRLVWPHVYSDDTGAHANDDGIHVEGDGHVVCHNTLLGFGDAMKVETTGARADDFYGNDVNDAYDNALELDQSQGNTRAFRNRFTNTYMPISFQPIFGGPAYAIRNLVINAAVEGVKIHNSTVGPVILNNTFMSAAYAFQVLDSTTAHAVTMMNNLWIGPATPSGGRSVNWDQPVDSTTDVVDWNGWYPEGQFHFGYGTGGANYSNFAAVVAGGLYEAHGRLVAGGALFASGLVTPPSYTTNVTPIDGTLASGSDAIDHGTILANITDGFMGAAPDLGAQETGCTVPIYGVRPEGVDESNESIGCGTSTGGDGGVGGDSGGPSSDSGASGDAGTTPGSSNGCGCHIEGSRSPGPFALAFTGLVALLLARRRR